MRPSTETTDRWVMSPHSAPTSTDCYRQRPRKHSISEPAFRSGRAASGSRSRTIPAQSARLIAPRDTHAPGLGTKRELGRFSWWGKGFVDHVFNNRALMVRTLVQNAAERGTPRNQAQPGLWPEGAQLPGRSRASRISSATRKRQGLRAHAPPQKDLRGRFHRRRPRRVRRRPNSNRRRPAWEDLSTLAICFSAPHQSASYEASMMQRDGRGEAVLMPLGDRFGDPISESAALRATFLERPESLASCSRAPRDCGARSTTVASLGILR